MKGVFFLNVISTIILHYFREEHSVLFFSRLRSVGQYGKLVANVEPKNIYTSLLSSFQGYDKTRSGPDTGMKTL